ISARRGHGVQRLTIFAKGNVDVCDSLVCSRVGGEVRWNGINEVVRQQFSNHLIRVRHETWTRSDALLHASGTVPDAILSRSLPLAPYTAESQFSRKLFDSTVDAVVLSIQPDVTTRLLSHRREGYLFYPSAWDEWPAGDQRWLRDHFGDL